MNFIKLNGIIQQIIERYPNVDLVELLLDELQLPTFKAEVLAQRIEKKYCQKSAEQKQSIRRLLKLSTDDKPTLEGGYSIDCLSDDEFRYFIRWLLEKSGYDISQEKRENETGVDFVAQKHGQPLLIIARKYPKNTEVSEAIFLISQKAKQIQGCERLIVAVTTDFSLHAKTEAEMLGIEIWNRDVLAEKIMQIRQRDAIEIPLSLPNFKDSLLTSLLKLEENKDFVIEQRINGKFELYLAGVKFPLLTFQAENDKVVRCMFRMKNYKPIGEHEAQALIWIDEANVRCGPSDAEAYDAVTKYLKDFVE
jgi:HJR/Mrr/RecB family endonuclease